MAGVNLYDKPIGAQFIETYVPIPFEQIAQVGAEKQRRYDVGMQGLGQLQDTASQLKFIPGMGVDDSDEAYIRYTQKTVQDIANKYSKMDLSNSIVQQQMEREIRTKIDKPRIQRMQESQSTWEANQKLTAQLEAAGLYNPLLDLNPAKKGYSTEQSGLYQHITSSYRDPNPFMGQYFKDVEGSTLMTRDPVTGKSISLTGPEGQSYIGVDIPKIKQIANEQWQNFMDTPVGMAELKLFKIRNPNWEEDGLTDKDIMRNMLEQVGISRFTWQREVPGSRGPGRASEDIRNAIINVGRGEATQISETDYSTLRSQRDIVKTQLSTLKKDSPEYKTTATMLENLESQFVEMGKTSETPSGLFTKKTSTGRTVMEQMYSEYKSTGGGKSYDKFLSAVRSGENDESAISSSTKPRMVAPVIGPYAPAVFEFPSARTTLQTAIDAYKRTATGFLNKKGQTLARNANIYTSSSGWLFDFNKLLTTDMKDAPSSFVVADTRLQLDAHLKEDKKYDTRSAKNDQVNLTDLFVDGNLYYQFVAKDEDEEIVGTEYIKSDNQRNAISKLQMVAWNMMQNKEPYIANGGLELMAKAIYKPWIQTSKIFSVASGTLPEEIIPFNGKQINYEMEEGYDMKNPSYLLWIKDDSGKKDYFSNKATGERVRIGGEDQMAYFLYDLLNL